MIEISCDSMSVDTDSNPTMFSVSFLAELVIHDGPVTLTLKGYIERNSFMVNDMGKINSYLRNFISIVDSFFQTDNKAKKLIILKHIIDHDDINFVANTYGYSSTNNDNVPLLTSIHELVLFKIKTINELVIFVMKYHLKYFK